MTLTKDQEIAELRAFIEARPDSYLADILRDAYPIIVGMIRSDFTCGLGDELRALQQQIADERRELGELQKRSANYRAESEAAERRTCKARDELDEILAMARTLARA